MAPWVLSGPQENAQLEAASLVTRLRGIRSERKEDI